jgi:hypothetical protein
MKKVVLALAVMTVAATWSGRAKAAEALLIRHDVIEVPVGGEAKLRPGFFIGVAHNLDGSVAFASMDAAHREVKISGRTPGRTIVTAWNLCEPNKRIELEVVVSDSGVEAAASAEKFYATTAAPATNDPAPAISNDTSNDDSVTATDDDNDDGANEDADTDSSTDETADPN